MPWLECSRGVQLQRQPVGVAGATVADSRAQGRGGRSGEEGGRLVASDSWSSTVSSDRQAGRAGEERGGEPRRKGREGPRTQSGRSDGGGGGGGEVGARAFLSLSRSLSLCACMYLCTREIVVKWWKSRENTKRAERIHSLKFGQTSFLFFSFLFVLPLKVLPNFAFLYPV